jgi:hypothetical protein
MFTEMPGRFTLRGFAASRSGLWFPDRFTLRGFAASRSGR